MKNLRPIRLGRRKQKKKIWKLGLIILIIAIIIALVFFLNKFSGTFSVVNFILSNTGLKSNDGRVNILLLGIAGGSHDGANLTDTILVATYDLKTNQLYLFSIPRDLWLPALKSKANAVYEIGLSQGSGLQLAKVVMGNILGIPIHYGLRVDFRGFIKAIDAIDGIDVEVQTAFDDYQYPIQGKENDLCGYEEKEVDFSEEEAKKLNIEIGKQKVMVSPDGTIATDSAQEDKGIKYFSCRYEHISFEKGQMHMNGAIALAYVRSRHGTNGEGSDFARSKRQQRVIEVVKSKILSLETLTNPGRISDLINTLGKSIDSDISAKDGLEFYKLSKKLDKTHSFVLDNSPKADLPNGRTSLLIHPSPADYGGAFVLVSEDDDFSIIQGYVRKILTGEITEYDATGSARTSN